jgi:hypothetical protein
MTASSCKVGIPLARANDDGDFIDAGSHDFVKREPQCGANIAGTIHQRLQGQRSMLRTGGGDDGFADLHDLIPPNKGRMTLTL